jgi:hypothetical protein
VQTLGDCASKPAPGASDDRHAPGEIAGA